MSRCGTVAVVAALVLSVSVAPIAPVAPVGTASGGVAVSGNTAYVANSGLTVTFNAVPGTELNGSNLFPANDAVRIESGNGAVEFSSSGNAAVGVSSVSFPNPTSMFSLSVEEHDLTVDPDDKPPLTLSGGFETVTYTREDGNPAIGYTTGNSAATATIDGETFDFAANTAGAAANNFVITVDDPSSGGPGGPGQQGEPIAEVRSNGTAANRTLGNQTLGNRSRAVAGAVSFGPVKIGETTSRPLTLENPGDALLSVSRIAIPNDNFSSSTGSLTVPAGGSRNLTITFSPTAVADYDATATLVSSAGNASALLTGRGINGSLAVSPESLSFPATTAAEGVETTANVTLSNEGTGPLRIENLSVSGEAFSLVSDEPDELAPNGSQQLTLGFAPRETGPFGGELTIETNDPDDPTATVSLSGTGEESSLSVEPGALDFGSLRTGATANRTLSLTNGAGRSITANFSIRGANASAFGTPGTVSIQPGSTGTAEVTATPTAGGRANATLTVTRNGSEAAVVPLTVNASAPNLLVDSSPLDFGSLRAGTRINRTVAMFTDADVPVIANLSIEGANTSGFTAPASVPVPSDDTILINVSTTGQAGSIINATLVVSRNNTEAARIPLTANVTAPPLETSPDTIDFGNVRSGATINRSLTLSTAGTIPLTANLSVEGDNTSTFDAPASVPVSPSGPLGSSDPTTANVTATPTVGGQVNATLVVSRNGSEAARIPLTANVSAPDIRLQPASLTFANATVNRTATDTVTIQNRGTAPLNITNVTVTGTGFSAGNGTGQIQPGDEQSLLVSFAPEQPGARTGRIDINSTDPDEPTASVFLASTRANVDLSLNQTNQTRSVSATVQNAQAGEESEVPLPGGDDVDAENPASFDEVSVTPEESGDFNVSVTTGEDRLETSPEFERTEQENTEPLSYANVTHSIPNEEIEEASLTTTVSKERLEELNTDAEDVSLYQFDNESGSYEPRDTAIVSETNDTVTVQANASGLSEWTAAARRPRFNITGATTNVTAATIQDVVTIQVFVRNTGGADGLYEAELLLNEDVVDRRETSIPEGGQAQLNFRRTFDLPGLYEVQVNDVPVGQVNISAANQSVEVQTVTPVPDDGDGAGSDGTGTGTGTGTTGETPANATGASGTTTGGGGPGFGATGLGAALAVLVAAAVARRYYTGRRRP